MTTKLLHWQQKDTNWEEAQLGTKQDGVLFTLTHHPTCYRRGPYRLLVEVCSDPKHHVWGCFDDQDQPLRNFHSRDNALSEAEALAGVLWYDRLKHSPHSSLHHQPNISPYIRLTSNGTHIPCQTLAQALDGFIPDDRVFKLVSQIHDSFEYDQVELEMVPQRTEVV